MKYTIIGNSTAAIGAVEAIRKNDQKSPITIISDEPYLTYSRPLISYLLQGKIDKEKMYYRDKDFYKRNNIKTYLGKKAVKIDTKNKYVFLENKKKIPYNKLLIATGGTPIVPPIKGLDRENVTTFTKWDDIKKLKKMLENAKSVLIIGGGLIGLKAAEGLGPYNVKITVVELADRVLVTALDKKGSLIIQKKLKASGVGVITNNTVTEILGNDKKVEGVILKNGKKIKCDIVIIAIGVKPNIDLIKGSGIKVNSGILVDEYMHTNKPDIYAAGDVTESYDTIMNEFRLIPIFPRAYIQGEIAGLNMCGSPTKNSSDFGMNSIEICGVPTISLGIIEEDPKKHEVLKKFDPEKNTYKKFILNDNVIVGAVFVGNIIRAGIFTGLIKEKIDVSEFKHLLLNDDFGFIMLPEEMRRHKLETKPMS